MRTLRDSTPLVLLPREQSQFAGRHSRGVPAQQGRLKYYLRTDATTLCRWQTHSGFAPPAASPPVMAHDSRVAIVDAVPSNLKSRPRRAPARSTAEFVDARGLSALLAKPNESVCESGLAS